MEKLNTIQSACQDCKNVISEFYYKKRNQCITNGKIINDSYVTFLLACRDSVWAIKHLIDFEFTLANDYKEIENIIVPQCDLVHAGFCASSLLCLGNICNSPRVRFPSRRVT